MTELYLTYNESRSGGYPLSEERWSDREPEHIDFDVRRLYLDRDNARTWQIETLEVDFDVSLGDAVYLVIVRYTDGDTFGYRSGNWHIEGVYKTIEEADEVRSAINKETYTHEQSNHGWLPWVGYFEHLENVDVYPMVVT
jgi:hypothetical protein